MVNESTEGPIDAGSVGLADSHGNCSGAVTDLAGLVEQVAGDSPVLIRISEVGVERSSQIEFGVVGEQSTDHLHCTAVGGRPGTGGIGVDVGSGDLSGDRFEGNSCGVGGGTCHLKLAGEVSECVIFLVDIGSWGDNVPR